MTLDTSISGDMILVDDVCVMSLFHIAGVVIHNPRNFGCKFRGDDHPQSPSFSESAAGPGEP